jgi:two-component system response regulator (stage 0 sporulation protein A)
MERKNKIIIFDNNEEFNKGLSEFYNNNDNIEIISNLKDVNEVVEYVSNNKVDIVVTDLVLKNADGFYLIEQLKKTENCPKIIVASAIFEDNFIKRAFSLGISYYMIKPVDYKLLDVRINEVLNGSDDEPVARKPILRNKQLEEKITNIFITVGIPAHIKGYQFLREAIKMAIDNPDIINSITKRLYPSIAERFETSSSKVERAIRHAIEVAWNRGKIENINSLFGIRVYTNNEKPTNGEFIALVADKMLIEGA